MKKGARVHCAGAVHVQMFCTCSSFAAPTGQTVRAADAKLAGYMYASTSIYSFVATVPFEVPSARARTGKVYLRGVLRF